MKRILFVLALSLMSAVASFACTNLVVGRLASADGSVICTYNCDGFGFASPLTYSPAGRHEPGEMVAIRGWGPMGREPRLIPQVEYTYGVVGLMNDQQVSIVETTWDGREELVNRDGYFDYFTLMGITLQRSATAREAIATIDALVQEYGYNSSGESFAICDLEEAAPTMAHGDLVDRLTAKTEEYTTKMMTRWTDLAKLLIVKYNDQTISRALAQGQAAPAYSPVFIDAVKSQTGDRYVKPDQK